MRLLLYLPFSHIIFSSLVTSHAMRNESMQVKGTQTFNTACKVMIALKFDTN